MQDKKAKERKIVNYFLQTELGKKWLEENKIQQSKLTESESPDFIFTTLDDKQVGLEVMEYLIEDWPLGATQHLKRIGGKIRAEVKQKHDIDVNIIFTLHKKITDEKRKMLERAYYMYCQMLPPSYGKPIMDKKLLDNYLQNSQEPCQIDEKFNQEKIKKFLLDEIEKNLEILKQWPNLICSYYDLPDKMYLKIEVSTWPNFVGGDDSEKVNNVYFIYDDQYHDLIFKDLQDKIDKKNDKVKKYLNKCDKCFLLIFANASNFGLGSLSLTSHAFCYNFSDVFFIAHNTFGLEDTIKLTQNINLK